MSAPAESGPGPNSAVDQFEQLVNPLLKGAYNTAIGFTRNAADAEDLVQDAVLLAYRGFSSFRPGTNFKAWFFRILSNAYFSKYRRAKREGSTVELVDTPELYLYGQTEALGLHQRTDDPAAALLDRLDREAVTAALAELPDEFRVAATLYFVDEMSYEEIATALAVPIGTVRSRLHRARRLLQRALWRVAVDRGIVSTLTSETR